MAERRSCLHCKEAVPRVVAGEHVYVWGGPNKAIHINCIIPGTFVKCRNCYLFVTKAEAHTEHGVTQCPACAGTVKLAEGDRRVQPDNMHVGWKNTGSLEFGVEPPKKCPHCAKLGVTFRVGHATARCRLCDWQIGLCLICNEMDATDRMLPLTRKTYERGKPTYEGHACTKCVKNLANCGYCGYTVHPQGKMHRGTTRQRATRIDDPEVEVEQPFCDTCWTMQRTNCAECKQDGWRASGRSLVNMAWYKGRYLDGKEVAQPLPWVCRECATTKAKSCRGCRNHWLVSQMTMFGNDAICPGCKASNEWGLCEGCGENAAMAGQQCADCGQPIAHYQARAPEVTGFLGTPPCHANCKQVRHDVIDRTPRGEILRRVTRWEHVKGCFFDALYLGVELEVESHDPAERIKNAIRVKKLFRKTAIIKHDGSLAAGFEIVSGPATLDFHRTMWDNLFAWQWDKANTSRPLLSHDAPDGTCGLHVHVSRDALTWLQIGKMVQFLHDDKNRDFIRFISGRPCSNYADFMVPKKLPVKDNGMPGIYRLKSDTGNRYTALNLQNKATVEFRIFRGTLIRNTFLARLEFVHALVKFCAPGVAGLKEMTAENFCAWLEIVRKEYPYLVPHLAKAGWVTSNEPKESR